MSDLSVIDGVLQEPIMTNAYGLHLAVQLSSVENATALDDEIEVAVSLATRSWGAKPSAPPTGDPEEVALRHACWAAIAQRCAIEEVV